MMIEQRGCTEAKGRAPRSRGLAEAPAYETPQAPGQAVPYACKSALEVCRAGLPLPGGVLMPGELLLELGDSGRAGLSEGGVQVLSVLAGERQLRLEARNPLRRAAVELLLGIQQPLMGRMQHVSQLGLPLDHESQIFLEGFDLPGLVGDGALRPGAPVGRGRSLGHDVAVASFPHED